MQALASTCMLVDFGIGRVASLAGRTTVSHGGFVGPVAKRSLYCSMFVATSRLLLDSSGLLSLILKVVLKYSDSKFVDLDF